MTTLWPIAASPAAGWTAPPGWTANRSVGPVSVWPQPASPSPNILPNPGVSPVGLHIARTALSFWNRSSEDGPDRGNLACAYMVNKILKQALGKTYGQDPDTVSSVRTDLLAQGGQRIFAPAQPQPGDLALSFNDAALQGIGGGTAHIGIYVAPNLILANSSKNRRFNHRLTTAEFARLYKYFEVIRPVEALQTRWSQWA